MPILRNLPSLLLFAALTAFGCHAQPVLQSAAAAPGQLAKPGKPITPELARRITKIRPDIRVIYMSGYAEGLPETELPPNSTFLQKPFRFATFLEQLKLVRRRA